MYLVRSLGFARGGDLAPTGPSARWSEVSRRAASQAVASGEQQAEKRARPSFRPEMPAMPPPAAPKAKAPTLPEEEIYPGLFNLLPDLHNAASPTPTIGETSHTQKDLKVAIPGAQSLTLLQLERNSKLEEASKLIDTELLTLPQRKELILEDGTLDIRTTYYEGGTMIAIPKCGNRDGEGFPSQVWFGV